MNRIRIGGHAAGHKTENEPVELDCEEADKLNDQAAWYEDGTEQEPKQD